MNLKELNSFKLSDAVTFHDKLNPKLWNGTKLRPEVRDQLIKIAEDFLSELGVNDLDVKDITISGSNAAYSYTKHSDLDLHILVDMGNLPVDEVYKELFNAKKTIYNDSHDITIHTIPVELYVQDSRQPVVSLGEYSVLNDEWIRIPTKRRSDFDQTATKSKYEKLLSLIEIALKSRKYSKVKHIIDTIKRYRQAGLDKGGEFGPENLAYKMLRSQGYITKLYELRDKLHSEKLSFETMYQNIDEDETSTNSKLDEILYKLCNIVKKKIKEKTGEHAVAACIIDPDNRIVAKTSKDKHGRWIHAEHNAIDTYEKKYGEVPEGSIIVTTLSPCNEYDDRTSDERFGESCTDYINSKGIKKVYCGYMDPTQDNDTREFDIIETSDKNLRHECKKFADTFLKKHIDEEINPDVLDARFNHKQEIGDYTYTAGLEPDGWAVEDLFVIRCYDGEKMIGQARFYTTFGDSLVSALTTVKPEYQKQGIASTMYAYARMLGNTIEPSASQLPPGKKMWKAWKKSGDAQYLMKNVEENYTMQYASEKTPPVSPYAGVKDNQYRGGISETADKKISFKIQKGKRKFATTLIVNNSPAGIYQYDSNTGRSIAEVYPEFQGKGLGKLLVLHAIYTAAQLGLDFQEDESRTRAYDNVLDSLSSNGYIVDDDGYWYVTGEGEQYLIQSLNESSGYIPSEKQKNDPRFRTALTVDINPYTMKKGAKQFGWNISRAGIPPTAKANGKV